MSVSVSVSVSAPDKTRINRGLEGLEEDGIPRPAAQSAAMRGSEFAMAYRVTVSKSNSWSPHARLQLHVSYCLPRGARMTLPDTNYQLAKVPDMALDSERGIVVLDRVSRGRATSSLVIKKTLGSEP